MTPQRGVSHLLLRDALTPNALLCVCVSLSSNGLTEGDRDDDRSQQTSLHGCPACTDTNKQLDRLDPKKNLPSKTDCEVLRFKTSCQSLEPQA